MRKEQSDTFWVHGGPNQFIRMKHSGLYDLEFLMRSARGWFGARGYYVIESEHSEAVKGAGKEMKFDWQVVRYVTDYVQFKFQFEVVVYREVDVVVEENEKKKRMQRGDLEARFRTSMVKNYRKTFRGPGSEFLRQTYERYLIKRELEGYEAKLNAEGDEFWDMVKRILGGFTR